MSVHGSQPPTAQLPPWAEPSPAPPRRRWGFIVALLAVVALLVVAVGYGWVATTRAAQWQRTAQAHEATALEREQENKALADELETTEAQLKTSNERLIELAGEKAQTADEREFLRRLNEQLDDLARENAELARQQNRIAAAATDAASAYAACASSQNQLIGHLLDNPQDTSRTNTLVNRVNADCQAAQDAGAALNQLLGG